VALFVQKWLFPILGTVGLLLKLSGIHYASCARRHKNTSGSSFREKFFFLSGLLSTWTNSICVATVVFQAHLHSDTAVVTSFLEEITAHSNSRGVSIGVLRVLEHPPHANDN